MDLVKRSLLVNYLFSWILNSSTKTIKANDLNPKTLALSTMLKQQKSTKNIRLYWELNNEGKLNCHWIKEH